MKTERAHAMFIYYRLICFTLMKENLYWEKKDFFWHFSMYFGAVDYCCLLSTHIFFCCSSWHFYCSSLVFIMMVCYFYIFQRFNLQLASHTHFTFYKLSLPLSKDMKKKVQYSQFHFSSFFLCCKRIENQCSP